MRVAGRIPCVAEIAQVAGSQSFNDFVSYINENGLPITDKAFDWTLTPGSMVSGFQLRFQKITTAMQSNGTLYWVPNSVVWECSNTSVQVNAVIQENEETDGVVPTINALGAFKDIPVGGWFTLKIEIGGFINKVPNKQKEVNLTFNRVK